MWVRAENADLLAAAFQPWGNRRMPYPRIFAWFSYCQTSAAPCRAPAARCVSALADTQGGGVRGDATFYISMLVHQTGFIDVDGPASLNAWFRISEGGRREDLIFPSS